MPEVRFKLDISSDEILRWYRGKARDVVVRAEDGRTVRFPARHLQRFVADDGVHGLFVMRYSDDGELIAIRRLGQSA